MSDAPIRFLRVRLFFAYSLIAWYSLFKPERGLTMLKDYGEAEDKRAITQALDRLKSRRRTGTRPAGKPTAMEVVGKLRARATSKGELG